MKNSVLVTLADKNYINPAKQLFASAYFNAGWDGDYLLLASQIPENELGWFRKKGILIKNCQSFSDKSMGRYHAALLNKFYLFTPEFKKWKNVVYLDADIIIRASLAELAEVNGFAVVRDEYFNNLADQFKKPSWTNSEQCRLYKKLKKNYNLKEPSFNNGVMAFSTDIIKADSFAKLVDILKTYHSIGYFLDQSPLNLFFYKRWKELPFVYNTNIFDGRKQREDKGIILHFCVPQKPWEYSKNNPFYQEWKDNFDKAEFIDLKKMVRSKKQWAKEEIKMIEEEIKRHPLRLKFLFKNKYFCKANYEKFIGLIGHYLFNYCPRLYFLLKNKFFK